MKNIKIYHNTRCGKSRCALDLLQKSDKPFELVEYLKTPPTSGELRHILGLLDKKPLDIIRQKEPLFQEQFKGKNLSDDEWLTAMTENPILIERPIVVADGRAWVARDAESLDAIQLAIKDL